MAATEDEANGVGIGVDLHDNRILRMRDGDIAVRVALVVNGESALGLGEGPIGVGKLCDFDCDSCREVWRSESKPFCEDDGEVASTMLMVINDAIFAIL